MRGLIAILLATYSGRTAKHILAIDAVKLFEGLGLKEHLTPQRSNGFRSMVERIRADARAALAPAARQVAQSGRTKARHSSRASDRVVSPRGVGGRIALSTFNLRAGLIDIFAGAVCSVLTIAYSPVLRGADFRRPT